MVRRRTTREHVDDAERPRVDEPAGASCVRYGDPNGAELNLRSARALSEVCASRHGGRTRIDPVERGAGGRQHPDRTQTDVETRDARGSGEARPCSDLTGGGVDAEHLIVA